MLEVKLRLRLARSRNSLKKIQGYAGYAKRLETMEANVRECNAAMLDLTTNLGFKITGDGEVKKVSILLYFYVH